MASRSVVLVGGFVGLGVASYLIYSKVLRDPTPAAEPVATTEPSGSARVISAPKAPELGSAAEPQPLPPTPPPTLPPVPPPPPAEAKVFDAEQRDPAWAGKTENEIKQRFAKVRGGKLTDVECRERQCRLTIGGTEGDVGQSIADLESTRGLHGWAKSLLLTAPERRADGGVTLRAFAVFER